MNSHSQQRPQTSYFPATNKPILKKETPSSNFDIELHRYLILKVNYKKNEHQPPHYGAREVFKEHQNTLPKGASQIKQETLGHNGYSVSNLNDTSKEIFG